MPLVRVTRSRAHHSIPQRPSPADSKSKSPHWHSGQRLDTSTYSVSSGMGVTARVAAKGAHVINCAGFESPCMQAAPGGRGGRRGGRTTASISKPTHRRTKPARLSRQAVPPSEWASDGSGYDQQGKCYLQGQTAAV